VRGDPQGAALDAYFASVVTQLQDAVLERDAELLAVLLATHDRGFAPDWARPLLDQFRQLRRTLAFELQAEREAELAVVGEPPSIGETVPLRLRLATSSEPGIVVPGAAGGSAAARILATVTVDDLDCYGGRSRSEFSEILAVPADVAFDDGGRLELVFGIPPLPAEGCEREIGVACDLLPGTLLVDGRPVPNQRTRLGEIRLTAFPRGIDGVRAHPYTHLRNGLESGDPRHFDNVFLAARLMDEEFREDAIQTAIRHVRVGRPEVARVAMAALRELSGVRISVEDRDGWLAWSQTR
jgi:hypothetical protein